MSFFRVLLALLISGGIAYGLYRAVDGKSLDRVVEAVRTEIAVPLGLETGAADGEETEQAALAADTDTNTGTDDNEEGETTETASAPAEESADEEGDDETDPTTGTTAGSDWTAVVTASTSETAEASSESGSTDETAQAAPADAAASTEDTQAEGSPTVTIATLPEMPAQPAAPAADTPVTAAETDGGEIPSLPALAIGATTNDSIKALDVISGGMTYIEARATMVEAGWAPRIPDARADAPNPTEAAMIEAGYGEVEGCREGERPLCRFEFMDGEKRIAAVLTAGTGADPSVIDAFLMNIRAE